MFGPLVMAVISMTTVTVTGIPAVYILYQSAAPHSNSRHLGMQRNVLPQWQQHTPAGHIMTNVLYV